MKTLKLTVKGMYCASCEVLIERNLKKIAGVHSVQVSMANNEAIVEGNDSLQLSQLQESIQDKGYTLSYKEEAQYDDNKIAPKNRFFEIGAFFIIILAVYFLLGKFNLLPKNFGVSENMSYGFILVLGLLAGTSTCLAVAGGLLLAVANKYNEWHQDLVGWQRFKPHISFNIGRILSYTILGGVIGLIGATIAFSPAVTGYITIVASLLMIIIGLQLLNIAPWLNRIQIKMPKFIAHKLYEKGHAAEHKAGTISAFFFGSSTFFLPCGFTQALQLYVLGQGDFLTGALTMFAFSIGTLPSLAGLGAIASFASGKVQRHFMTFSAVLVILLGIFVLPSGLTLAGVDVSSLGSSQLFLTTKAASTPNAPTYQQDPNVRMENGKQIVEMKVIGLDYYPSHFRILQGVPVEWRVDGSQAQGCAKGISAQKIGVREILPNGIKSITFMPNEVGKIQFSCSMGMAGPGAFEVVAKAQNQIEQGCNAQFANCLA